MHNNCNKKSDEKNNPELIRVYPQPEITVTPHSTNTTAAVTRTKCRPASTSFLRTMIACDL